MFVFVLSRPRIFLLLSFLYLYPQPLWVGRSLTGIKCIEYMNPVYLGILLYEVVQTLIEGPCVSPQTPESASTSRNRLYPHFLLGVAAACPSIRCRSAPWSCERGSRGDTTPREPPAVQTRWRYPTQAASQRYSGRAAFQPRACTTLGADTPRARVGGAVALPLRTAIPRVPHCVGYRPARETLLPALQARGK